MFYRLFDKILAFILQEVASYRNNVVQTNLKASFPYTSSKQLQTDIHRFYLHLSRILRENLRKPSIKTLRRKVSLSRLPEMDQWLASGKSVVIAAGHMGNWEWANLYMGLEYPGQTCTLYKEIKSKRVNKWMLNRRLSTVDYMIDTTKMPELIRLIRSKPVLILMGADQNPGNDRGIIWADFLGRDTAFVSGPETLAAKYELPVVYLKIIPKKNNGYELSFDMISDGMEKLPEGEIIARYAKALEKNIKEYKTGWLWSHRRWKRQR